MSRAVRHRFAALAAALCAVSLAFVVSSCGSEPRNPVAPSSVANSSTDLKGGATDQCAAGGIKVERAPYTAAVPEGEVVTSACVKAATRTFNLTTLNTSDACYSLSVENDTAEVTKIGSGRSCPDISYVTIYTATPTPTPTPTPTNTPTPIQPTPTPTPTNTPTPVQPTPTPTPTNTPTPVQPTPTPTPTNTPTPIQPTPTPTPTNTPTPIQPTPTPTPTNTPTPVQPTPTPTPPSLSGARR